VRSRILTELDAHGELRAADVARLLGIEANSASFHLRQLARFGLIEEDPAAARDKRDRVWRQTAAAEFDVSLSQLAKAPGGEAAVRVFRNNKEAWAHHLVAQAYAPEHEKGTEIAVVEQALRLTKEETRQVADELAAVVLGWRDRTRGRGDHERRTYHVLQIVQPFPDDQTES
jgi:predicted ArsR family transcriptional regulator